MPQYNFQEKFAPLILQGWKRSTFRKRREKPPKPGDILYLFTGQRTANCHKIGQYVCKSHAIGRLEAAPNYGLHFFIDGQRMPDFMTRCFALADGFRSVQEMRRWFESHYGLPFEGDLVTW
jgi:hypothetical protein